MNEWVRRAIPALMISTGLLFTGAAVAHAEDSVGNQGVGNGNQVNAPIRVPVNVCGNSLGVLGGHAEGSCGEDPTESPKPTPSLQVTPTPTVVPSVTPSVSESPKPGGGGSPDESLPLTGASVGWMIGIAMLLLAGGAAMIIMARRRVIRRGAHAA